jgi:hypothetical protein
MFVTALLPEAAVEYLHKSVIRGFDWTTEIELNVVPVRPTIQIFGDGIGAIVNLDHLRASVLPANPPKDLDYIHPPDALDAGRGLNGGRCD